MIAAVALLLIDWCTSSLAHGIIIKIRNFFVPQSGGIDTRIHKKSRGITRRDLMDNLRFLHVFGKFSWCNAVFLIEGGYKMTDI